MAQGLSSLGPSTVIGAPRAALALARTQARGPRDPALALAMDRVLREVRPVSLLRQRARLALDLGELTAGLALWTELEERGASDAARERRLVEGRLTASSTDWLPDAGGPAEPLTPVSRRRILHLVKNSVPDRWSGYTIRTHNNARAQRDDGLEPIVVNDIGWPALAGVMDVQPLVHVDGLPHYRLDGGPVEALKALPADVRLQRLVDALVPLVRELRPAIIQAHSGYRGGELVLAALALRERFGIPVVYEVRGLFESVWHADEATAERAELFARLLALETHLLHQVDGVLVISEALIEELASRGIPREKMALLPNGIDPDAFAAPERDEALRRELGLEGRFVVGYVGNLDHQREGMEVLVAAVAELKRRGRDEVAALIVGDGPRRSVIKGHARRLGVADRCRLTGRVPHDTVAQYYAQMDLFTCPRIEERAARYITPLKPFEAMALGRPVLVSDLPALTEIVDPPNRGITAPVGDPVALADAIEQALDDPDLRARVAAAGREWVRSERTWAANGPRYRAAFEAIIGPIP
jgi:glycosyltransferase involved in cell wall biosynthesis